MRKYIVFCILIITISYSSIASIVNYNLTGYFISNGVGGIDAGGTDANGFLSFESVGVPIPDSGYNPNYHGYVEFKVYEFSMASPNDGIINTSSGKIRFPAMQITADKQTILYLQQGDMWFTWLGNRYFHFDWIGYETLPEDGTLIFAPNTFRLGSIGGSPYFFGKYDEAYFCATVVSIVDEPGIITFILFGFFSIFLLPLLIKGRLLKPELIDY